VGREIDGLVCLTSADFVGATEKAPPGASMPLACAGCHARIFFVTWLRNRRLLAFQCCNCGEPGAPPVILEGREAEAPAAGRIIS
jgi:hypothetical protein